MATTMVHEGSSVDHIVRTQSSPISYGHEWVSTKPCIDKALTRMLEFGHNDLGAMDPNRGIILDGREDWLWDYKFDS